MNITVAICTWNRADLLAKTLARMESLQIPPGMSWELLVVNNACTDNTESIVQSFRQRLPIRHLYEPKQGHCNARNCAVDAAQGDLMVWTDDDVLVSSHWLQEYFDASIQFPECDFFGGPIRPWFEGTPPKWMPELLQSYETVFALRDFLPETTTLDRDHLPFGANFAIRRATQSRFRYDPNLGRKGSGMLGSDETTVLTAVIDAGGKGRWIASAEVLHFIPHSRQTTGYLYRYFSGQGQVLALTAGCEEGPKIFGRPRWRFRQAIQAAAQYYASRWICSPVVWAKHLEAYGLACGGLKASQSNLHRHETAPSL
jgi:glycosyltransferase involved in cell wall biosynthesis